MTDLLQFDLTKICLSCGQVKRPELYLNDVEKMELDRLLEQGDWRTWATKVLEHLEPIRYAAKKLLYEALEGKFSPEEFEKRSKELAQMQEDESK